MTKKISKEDLAEWLDENLDIVGLLELDEKLGGLDGSDEYAYAVRLIRDHSVENIVAAIMDMGYTVEDK